MTNSEAPPNLKGMRQIQFFLLTFLLAAVSAVASPLNYTSDYNVLVFGDLTANSHIGGAVAVGGSANFQNVAIAGANGESQGYKPASGPGVVNLIVGGDLTMKNGSLVNGSGVYGGTALLQNVGTPDGTINFGTVPVDFVALADAAQAASASFAAMAANGTATLQWGGLTLTGTSTELNIFEVSAADLGAISWMEINVPVGAPVLINVTGTNVNFKNAGLNLNGSQFNHNQNASQWGEVLWNFSAAGTFTIESVKFAGTLLAPNAEVSLKNGQVNGQLIAGSLVQKNSAIHNFTFNGTKVPTPGDETAPVPEPETYLLTACGLLLVMVGKRRLSASRENA
jgi:choice-of-anchor A domain-containing protein